MARKRQTLYIAPVGSYAAADPSADGSGYSWVPCLGVPAKKDNMLQLATGYAAGSTTPTAPEPGPDGCTITFTTPIGGFVTAAGNGSAPPTADWFDTLLEAAFGSIVARNGVNVGSGSTTSSLVLASDILSIYDLAPVYDSSLAAVGRTQWTRIMADAGSGTYGTVAPEFGTAPTAAPAGVCFGTRSFRPADTQVYVAVVFVDDTIGAYYCPGGRVILKSIAADHRMNFVATWEIQCDSKTPDAGKTALPNPGAGPAFRPLNCVRSPVYFNGAAVETSKISIDFGTATAPIGATAAPQGLGGNEITAMVPRINIMPQRASGYETIRRAITEGSLLMQLGGGVLSGGQLGTMALHLDNAYFAKTDDADDQGVMRQDIEIVCADAARFSGTTRAPLVQLVRA